MPLAPPYFRRMKEVNRTGPELLGPELPGRRRWSAKQVYERMCEHCLIVDVRSKEAFAVDAYCTVASGPSESDSSARHFIPGTRISRMREVVARRVPSGRNSRCMPQPIKSVLIIDPPHVEPSTFTGMGSGQNSGRPDINASPSPWYTIPINTVLGEDFDNVAGLEVSQVKAFVVGLNQIARGNHDSCLLTKRAGSRG